MEPLISAKNLLKTGAHFGHRISRWNPKMSRYIFTKRNRVHIIDLRETIKGFIDAYHFLKRVAGEGKRVLFVGTKRQSKSIVLGEAARCGMYHVTERWLGGTLTNLDTIRKQIERLKSLEKAEEDGTVNNFTKKELSRFRREKRRITRNLDGIREMNRLPAALVVIDPGREHIAVEEARKLGIPVIALIDTDADPDPIDIPIPCNDDAIQGIKLIVSRLADAALEGRGSHTAGGGGVPVKKGAVSFSSDMLDGDVEKPAGGAAGLPRSASPKDKAPRREKKEPELTGVNRRRGAPRTPGSRGARRTAPKAAEESPAEAKPDAPEAKPDAPEAKPDAPEGEAPGTEAKSEEK